MNKNTYFASVTNAILETPSGKKYLLRIENNMRKDNNKTDHSMKPNYSKKFGFVPMQIWLFDNFKRQRIYGGSDYYSSRIW